KALCHFVVKQFFKRNSHYPLVFSVVSVPLWREISATRFTHALSSSPQISIRLDTSSHMGFCRSRHTRAPPQTRCAPTGAPPQSQINNALQTHVPDVPGDHQDA